jgi:hypothetical protein
LVADVSVSGMSKVTRHFNRGRSKPRIKKCEIAPFVPAKRSDRTIGDLAADTLSLIVLAQEMMDAGWTAQAERLIEDVYAFYDQFS